MYVDDDAWRARARRGCCTASGSASAGSTTSGWASRRGWRSSTWWASRCCVTSDERAAAARGVQRLPAPRLAAAPGRAGDADAGLPARPRRCAAPTTRGPTRSTARCCGPRTPTSTSTRPRSRCTRWAWRRGAASSSCTSPRSGAATAGDAVAGPASGLANYALGELVTGAALQLRGGRQLQGARRELQRVLPLRPRAPRAPPAGAGVRRRRRAASTGTSGIPHREGAWTFTTTGTTDRRAAARADEDERERHKGELVYPNLMLSASADHVAAFVLLPHGRGPHRRSTARCCSHRDEVATTRLRPLGRRRPVGPGQPAGLGDLRVGAARHVVARLPARLVRADGGRQPRHPALAAAAAGAAGTPESDGDGASTTSSSGSARSAAPRLGSSRGAGTGSSGSSGSSSATPRRQPRHQPDPAAQLPHARRTCG